MKEHEYIITTHLARLRCAKGILRDICPEIDGVIHAHEYREVFEYLTSWESALSIDVQESSKE